LFSYGKITTIIQRKQMRWYGKNTKSNHSIKSIAMSEIMVLPSGRSKTTKNYKKVLKVDMTPMVDLGFLLITFFIFTTSIAEQKVAPLIVPVDGPSMNLPESTALTVLLGADNKVMVYPGALQNALTAHQMATTTYSTYSGIGTVIRQQQHQLPVTGKKDKLMLLIKPTKEATYQNIIDALDEVQINNVKRYAIVSPDEQEVKYISAH